MSGTAPWLDGLRLPLSGPALAAALRSGLTTGALDLPLPGCGATARRWELLAQVGAADLALARLVEGHTDAVAVLAELGEPAAGGLWGVWAAEPPGSQVRAEPGADGWRLTGTKAYCSGIQVLDRALVTAVAPDGRRLFAVAARDLVPLPHTWPAVGMADSGSLAAHLDDVVAEPVGGPGAYLARPGFWHGAIGVAACWYGGALGVGRTLLRAARDRDVGPHALAHLGAVDAVLVDLGALLHSAAQQVDADPGDLAGCARLRAARVRARVEAGATEVLDRVGRALGAGPLCLDPAHARRAADLPVYLRQSHAERGLAELGELAAQQAVW